jgi:hypothetical protein
MARRPWDQLPGETDEHYAAFLRWLHLGLTRRLQDVPDPLEAERRRWQSRAHAFDLHFFPQQLERMLANLAALRAAVAEFRHPAPPS